MSSTDFVRSCTTNARMVEDVSQMQYALYRSDDSSTSFPRLQEVIGYLRENDVLCTLVRRDVWVFRPPGTDLSHLAQPQIDNLTKYDEGPISAHPQPSSAHGLKVNDVLLDAIEGSIAVSLAKQQGFTHIGPWQWLFTTAQSGSDDDTMHMLLHLSAKLNEAGTLVFCTKVLPSCVRPLSPSQTTPDIVLAPRGLVATLVTKQLHDGTILSNTSTSITEHSGWKRAVSASLATEGIHIGKDEQWVATKLQNYQNYESALWPLRLCFINGKDPQSQATPMAAADWRQWFRVDDPDGPHDLFRNPLALAEECFSLASKPSETSNNDTDEPPVAAEEGIDTTDMVTTTPLITSSPFNPRTAELQAAMSGIYPTPPDGLIAAPVPSQQITAAESSAEVLQENDLSQYAHLHDSHRSQGESLTSSVAMTSYQADTDDLFGDIGEIDFGANEIEDADFDYFDAPDEVENIVDEQREDIAMTSDPVLAKSNSPTQPDALQSVVPTEDTSLVAISSPNAHPLSQTLEAVVETNDNKPPLAPDQPAVVSKQRPNPLSPFSIRERLLPPPVPASVRQQAARPLKRSRAFGPMDFNESLDLGRKYLSYAQYRQPNSDYIRQPSITLPPRRQNSQGYPVEPDSLPVSSSEDGNTSDGDSAHDSSDAGETRDDHDPPTLPWDTHKRKREMHDTEEPITHHLQDLHEMQLEKTMYDHIDDSFVEKYMEPFQHSISRMRTNHGFLSTSLSFQIIDDNSEHTMTMRSLPAVDQLFRLTKLDIVYIAQIISEQALSPTLKSARSIRRSQQSWATDQASLSHVVQTSIERLIDEVFASAGDCPVEKLSLNQELNSRNTANPRTTMHHPKLLARENNMQALPAIFAVPAPSIRMQRGSDTWEMLPSALPFWSILSLGPANASKDVEVVCVIPDNPDLTSMVEDFLLDLRFAYEGCKLGTFSRAYLGDGPDGIVPVTLPENGTLDFSSILKAYAAECSRLGEILACIEGRPPNRSTVICIVDPFEEDQPARQYLCACFWLLYKVYRDSATKDSRTSRRGDLVLQIIPMSMIASPHEMVVQDAQSMATLAMEIYDRCPPSVKMTAAMDTSDLSILAAPAVELAPVPPRRIAFQSASDPPSDLLHEGSILHVAYALSNDAQWMSVCWIDGTGHYQRTVAFSLRGKSLADAISGVWEQTLQVIATRDVMWRIFIVSAAVPDNSVIESWKKASTVKPRKQMLHITLLSLESDPEVQLTPPQPAEGAKAAASATTPGGGFLTPASTPQALTVTVSPDASGQTSSPLTPAPTETTTGAPETDPDAFLIDTTDESWGMLLTPSTAHSDSVNRTPNGVVNGLLLRRGNLEGGHLETLGVYLHWDIRLRPNGLVDDGHSRQMESSLREVLKMFRNLCLLTKLRGLAGSQASNRAASIEPGLVPIHALSAVEGAQALNELLR